MEDGSIVKEAYKSVFLAKATAHIPKNGDSWDCRQESAIAFKNEDAKAILQQKYDNIDDITYTSITLWEYLYDYE